MDSWASLAVVCCWFIITLMVQLCIATVKTVGQDGMQKMTFKTPNISDEEKHSNFMPEQLKCDACRIVAYQVCNDSRRQRVVLMGLFANIGLFAVYFCIVLVLLYF